MLTGGHTQRDAQAVGGKNIPSRQNNDAGTAQGGMAKGSEKAGQHFKRGNAPLLPVTP